MGSDLSPGPEYADPKGCLARIAWMMFGNVALFGFVLAIARVPPWTLSWLDVAFWGVVGGSIFARYVDAKSEDRAVEGAPPTTRLVRRYAAVLGPLALMGWAAAHSVQV